MTADEIRKLSRKHAEYCRDLMDKGAEHSPQKSFAIMQFTAEIAAQLAELNSKTLSKREQIASSMMQAVVSDLYKSGSLTWDCGSELNVIANASLKLADAMLTARGEAKGE